MYILRALASLLFITQVLLAQEPTPIVPSARLTPGDAFDVKAQDLCVPGYTKKVRNVPAEMKREVYREYGITSHGPGDYEIDQFHSNSAAPIQSKISGQSPIEPRRGTLKLKTGSKTSFMSWFAVGN
jgi:hypothetical protein